MLELLLLRHAKSRRDQPDVGDHERNLAPRGERAAKLIGKKLAAEGPRPSRVLCSTATRARHTWDLVRAELPSAPEPLYIDELYLAPPGRMLKLVRRHGGDAKRLLLIGHNPGMQALALRLAHAGDATLRGALAEKFPTAALARLSFDAGSWQKLEPEKGRLLAFWRPRELA